MWILYITVAFSAPFAHPQGFNTEEACTRAGTNIIQVVKKQNPGYVVGFICAKRTEEASPTRAAPNTP